MKILVDIVHPADINFYKNAINTLQKKSHIVTISVMKRGNLPEKVVNEYPELEVIVIGEHKKDFFGKLLNIFRREFLFFKLFKQRKFDVVTSFGFYPGMTSWIFGIKSVHFHDDKEYKLNYFLTKTFCSKFVSLCEKSSGNTLGVNSYKELAYLHPSYIKEDKKILSKLGLVGKRYVYIRDVSNISLNYKEKEKDFEAISKELIKKKYSVVFDSEKEQKIKGTISLNSPLTSKEMISLKKNASLIITSGDTVLREGALLGVPTIYTSKRKMKINANLLENGLFVRAETTENILLNAKMLDHPGVRQTLKEKARNEIKKCSDINKIIIKVLER